jgi:hypothetical protein
VQVCRGARKVPDEPSTSCGSRSDSHGTIALGPEAAIRARARSVGAGYAAKNASIQRAAARPSPGTVFHHWRRRCIRTVRSRCRRLVDFLTLPSKGVLQAGSIFVNAMNDRNWPPILTGPRIVAYVARCLRETVRDPERSLRTTLRTTARWRSAGIRRDQRTFPLLTLFLEPAISRAGGIASHGLL